MHYLNNILNDFLSIERLDSGKGQYKFIEFSLKRLINEVVYNANITLKDGQELLYPKEQQDLLLYQDEKIVELILSNLLSNAVKYSPENTTIEFRVNVQGDRILFEVEDQGRGIPQKDQKHIFERYFRAENALLDQGTGIGLNIAKAHLENLGGSISFKSIEHKGTTFRVELPVKKFKMKHLLLIEDDVTVRENTAELLELSDYEVTTASNGKLGISRAVEVLPDLIICDIMMPETDGYGVLEALSQNPKTANIPFIFLSAKTEHKDIRKGMDLGADDYLTKPFEEEDLLSAIESRLAKVAILRSFDQRTEKAEPGSSLNDLDDLRETFRDQALLDYKKRRSSLRKRQTVQLLLPCQKRRGKGTSNGQPGQGAHHRTV